MRHPTPNENCFSLSHLRTGRGSVAYHDRGRGKTVILIHGSVSDLRIWRPLIPGLAKDFRVISYSRRHHWPNPAPYDEYSFLRDADDLEELIRQLEVPAVHLVAHSAGGSPAMVFATRYPRQVTSLTLFDPNVSTLLSERDAMVVTSDMRAWLDPVRSALAAGHNAQALRHLLEALRGTKRLPRWFTSMASDNLAALDRQFSSTLPAPAISCNNLKKYSGAALVLQGDNSPSAFKLMNETLRRCLRNGRLKTIERCGHIFQIDAPRRVLNRIVRFMQRQT